MVLRRFLSQLAWWWSILARVTSQCSMTLRSHLQGGRPPADAEGAMYVISVRHPDKVNYPAVWCIEPPSQSAFCQRKDMKEMFGGLSYQHLCRRSVVFSGRVLSVAFFPFFLLVKGALGRVILEERENAIAIISTLIFVASCELSNKNRGRCREAPL